MNRMADSGDLFKIVIASDSFKGSLTSKEIARIASSAAKDVLGDNCECLGVLVADGGEGTVEALLDARPGRRIDVRTHDALGREISAYYGAFGDTAVIEMAKASGLTLIKPSERDLLRASTYGTGEMLLDASVRGFNKIYLTVGGSATNDGGMGALEALGAIFYDEKGKRLTGCGGNLEKIARIDVSDLVTPDVTLLCDVISPLTGEHGAAGGLAAGMMCFLNADHRVGIDAVLDLIGFDELIKGADLVITGEGRTDVQTLGMKAPMGVALRAKKAGVPVWLISGIVDGADDSSIRAGLKDYGITDIFETSRGIPLDEAMRNAGKNYYETVCEALRR